MLYLIGTGLYYLNDIPLRAIDKLKECDEVFLERYTNLNDITSLVEIEKTLGKKIVLFGREEVESELIVKKARDKKVALLVPGDPLSATTHISLIKECKTCGIKYEIIHASSIFTAVAETGLSLYKFGSTCSIPIYSQNFKPDSFFDTIEKNNKLGLHTLVLLEVRSEKEFVSVASAVALLQKIEKGRKHEIIDWENVIGLSQLGSSNQRIFWADNSKVLDKPPSSIIIPGELSPVEKENIKTLVSSN